MANLAVKNAGGTTVYLKMSGAGTDIDPHVPEQAVTVTGGAVTIGSALPAGSANIGDVDVASVTIPTAIYHGQTTVTTAGTEVALAAAQAILSGVTIKALHTNTGMIYVGKNPVTSATGYVLDAGEQIFIEVANLATVYIDSSVNGEGVSWVAS